MNWLPQLENTDVVTLIAAGAGALFGSLSAYMLEIRHEQKVERDSRHAALLQTQFVLMTHLNTLLCLQQQHLQQFREQEDRFMALYTLQVPSGRLSIDFQSLMFMVNDSDPNALHDIFLAERCFTTAIDTLVERNKRYADFVDDPNAKKSNLDFKTGKADIEGDAGKARFLMAVTDALYESVDDGVAKCQRTIQMIESTIKTLFPNRKALAISTSRQ